MRDATDSVAAAASGASGKGLVAQQHINQQVALWAAEPWALDFFAALRRLEALAAPAPRWGQALLPRAEGVRIGQEPGLEFAPAAFSRFELPHATRTVPLLRQQFFGYLGANGPLPVHLSDLIRERARNAGDGTWLAFLDTLLHRFALHLYRAWVQPRPAVALDRPGDDLFRRWVGALVGMGTPARQQRDDVHDDARLHFAGWLIRRMHNAEAVEAVISSYFGVPARVERWVGHWMPISANECTRLGASNPNAVSRRLGRGAVLGRRVWDRQHRVRLRLGPLDLARYQMFLPNGTARPVLQRWMQQLLGDELEWDAELVLAQAAVPATRLGQVRGNAPRLGWMSWLGAAPRTRDAADVRLPSAGGSFKDATRQSFDAHQGAFA